jgi:hypothetical protein
VANGHTTVVKSRSIRPWWTRLPWGVEVTHIAPSTTGDDWDELWWWHKGCNVERFLCLLRLLDLVVEGCHPRGVVGELGEDLSEHGIEDITDGHGARVVVAAQEEGGCARRTTGVRSKALDTKCYGQR